MSATITATKIRVKILRQKSAGEPSHWDTFEVPYQDKINVISALMEIRKKPVTADGKTVEPPAWEAACLEEVCGSCTMNINGGIRQACTALIEEVGELVGDTYEVTLEPMKKFPLIRDLMVDRSKMFNNLIKVKAWVPIDGSYDLGMAQPQDDHVRQLRYALSRCMTCGCCMEACPQINEKSSFIGPATLAQSLLFNLHPIGKGLEGERMEVLTSEEGITGCGNAQNCVKVCPKGVPLTRAIAQLNRDTTVYKIKKWMGLS
ncbi:MAG: succinate dehydrogenase iron-sulfur subunit [Armatimonadetes bacterium 55-13]|nr:succinate dehydrogenase iron-sulfur subunit [Armatimonadota bacterium]OJU63455.1 MAG: succinate dehydrogenase iron-sulfur subunit [Armatimonadetes bacterium 55-13]